MPWLSSCCCGFSIRSGTKAVAILSLLYSVFGLLAVGTFNYGKEVMERESSGGHQTRRPSGFQQMQNPINSSKNNAPDPEEEQKYLNKIKKIEELMTMYAVSVSVNFLVSLSLLIGVKMEKKWLLVPWVVWTALNLVISEVVSLYALDRATTSIPEIFSTAITVYCMLCVISYYQILSRSRPQPSSSLESATLPSGLPADSQCASFPACSTADLTTTAGVGLPPPPASPPPAYTADNPPVYDPPPPYPGSPQQPEKALVVRLESETGPDTEETGAEPVDRTKML